MSKQPDVIPSDEFLPDVITSDKFLPDESKTYLITATYPNGNFLKVNINNNIFEINKRRIKGIKEVTRQNGMLVYEGTDVETEKPIALNKNRLSIEFEDMTEEIDFKNITEKIDGGKPKRKTRKQRKSKTRKNYRNRKNMKTRNNY